MKKLISVLLVLTLVLSLGTTAFAADPYSITINNAATGHTYEAYQIFTGDLSNGVLSNIQWGASVTNAATLGDAAAIAERLDPSYAPAEDDPAKLTVDELLELVTLSGTAYKDSGETNNPYVINDLAAGYYLVKDKDNSLSGNDAYTEYIIKVVEDVETAPKSDVPEVVKKVKDTNDSTGEVTDWQDSADYDIGDAVPFQLKATLANNVSAYDTYKVVFHDTLSAGLTYNNDAKVYIDGKEVEGFTVAYEGTALTISCDNVKALGATNSSVITVEYTATLNENAVIGSAGNPNEVYLEYSNNPNWTPAGDEGPEDSPTGKTPKDKVIVFTYQVIVNKTDKDGNALEGAGFTLYKKNADGEYVAIGKEMKGEDLTTFTWKGLDDGDYKLEETTTPAGYNTIDPIEFTVAATHDKEADEPQLLTLTGGDKFTGDVETGVLTADVVNYAGATLPETGGMGTTMFYVIGGLMAVAAVVLLVTKKRMHDAA